MAPIRKMHPMPGDARIQASNYRCRSFCWIGGNRGEETDIILQLPGSRSTVRFKKREWVGEVPSRRFPLLSSNGRRASVNCMSHATRRCRHREGSQQAPCNDSDGGGFMVIGGAVHQEREMMCTSGDRRGKMHFVAVASMHKPRVGYIRPYQIICTLSTLHYHIDK